MKKILSICIVLLLTGTSYSQDIFREEPNLYSTRSLKLSVTTGSSNNLTIKSAGVLHGSIRITTGNKGAINATYTKKAKTENRSRALDYIDLISVVADSRPNGITLEMRAPNPAPWSTDELGLVDLELEIPEFFEVTIEAGYFDIDAEGPFDKISIPKSLGKCVVSNVVEELTIHTVNRRLLVEDISGKIDISTKNSTLVGKNLTSTEERIDIRNDGGDINLSDIRGELQVRNKYGRIEIEKFEPIGDNSYIRSVNGPITIHMDKIFTSQVIIANAYEDIEIEVPSSLSAEFSLAVEQDSKIEIVNLPVKPDLIEHNRMYLRTGEGTALINGSVQGEGNIYLRGINE